MTTRSLIVHVVIGRFALRPSSCNQQDGSLFVLYQQDSSLLVLYQRFLARFPEDTFGCTLDPVVEAPTGSTWSATVCRCAVTRLSASPVALAHPAGEGAGHVFPAEDVVTGLQEDVIPLGRTDDTAGRRLVQLRTWRPSRSRP
jgi:hypothetical protein